MWLICPTPSVICLPYYLRFLTLLMVFIGCWDVKIDGRFFESLEEFRYLGTTLTNRNCIQENPLSSRLLPKNLKIKIYRTIILPVVLYGCEAWSLTLREE